MVRSGETPQYIEDDDRSTLLELACADCRKALWRDGVDVKQVYHYYNIMGEWVRTKTIQ